MIAALFALFLQVAASAAAPPALSVDLHAKDQALLDAVATGDRAVWDRNLAANAVYVDENGQVMMRAELLSGLTGLPAGVTGNITIVEHQVQLVGDTAIVVHRDQENENFHGQALAATYLTTETWVRSGAVWRLVMVHVHVVNRDPPAIEIPPARMDEYVGRYMAAPDIVWVIRRDSNHLIGGREGGVSHTLSFEAPDIAFVSGQPRARKLFQRDAAGRISGFLDRREGEDLRWSRTS